jgi:hypothetical protein
METGKTGKYFKYAIGEIVLVVLGILIALQINNWNTNQQDQKKEIRILTELKTGLEADNTLLQTTLKKYTQDHKQLNTLDSVLKLEDHPYSKSLNSLFGKVYGIRFVRVNSAFYEDIKSSGLQIIRDDAIRSKIVNLFENNYKFLDGLLEFEKNVNEVLRPYYLANFTNIDFSESAHPIDFKKIWGDPYYKNIVHYRIITLQSNHLKNFKNTIDAIEAIVNEINNYLQDD